MGVGFGSQFVLQFFEPRTFQAIGAINGEIVHDVKAQQVKFFLFGLLWLDVDVTIGLA